MNDHRMDEARLEGLARRLGAEAAERLDVERVAAAVVARLRSEPLLSRTPSPWWIQPAWQRAAAVVVLMLGAAVVARAWRPIGSAHPAHYVAEDLEGLSTDQLREVLGTLDQTLDEATPEQSEDELNDLTTEQLQALLRSLEG